MARADGLFGSITAWGRQPATGVKGRGRTSTAHIDVDRFVKTDASMYVGRERLDRTISSLCTFDQLDSPRFRLWADALHEPWRAHRKLW